jgi:hypothetical protein
MVGAGATRSAIRITLSDRRESVSAVRRVLYPIFYCYSVFKASSPCLSAEPTKTTF